MSVVMSSLITNCSFEPVVFGELLEPESSETVHELSSTDLQVTK